MKVYHEFLNYVVLSCRGLTGKDKASKLLNGLQTEKLDNKRFWLFRHYVFDENQSNFTI